MPEERNFLVLQQSCIGQNAVLLRAQTVVLYYPGFFSIGFACFTMDLTFFVKILSCLTTGSTMFWHSFSMFFFLHSFFYVFFLFNCFILLAAKCFLLLVLRLKDL